MNTLFAFLSIRPHWTIASPDFSLLFSHIFTLASPFLSHWGVKNLKKFAGREAILWRSKVYVILVKGHLRASPGASSQKPQNQGPAPYYKMPQVKFLSSSYYTGSGQKKTKMLQKEAEWQESQRQTRKTLLDSKTVIKSMVTAASVRQWCRRQDAICPTSPFRFQLTNNDAINTFLLLNWTSPDKNPNICLVLNCGSAFCHEMRVSIQKEICGGPN